jgi:hypothetical protein
LFRRRASANTGSMFVIPEVPIRLPTGPKEGFPGPNQEAAILNTGVEAELLHPRAHRFRGIGHGGVQGELIPIEAGLEEAEHE